MKVQVVFVMVVEIGRDESLSSLCNGCRDG